MAEQALPPLRILIKGASTVVWTSDAGSGRHTDYAYPRALEFELYRRGLPAQITTVARGGASSFRILDNWEQEIQGDYPDVVILNTGHYETIHAIAPRWLERHAHNLARYPGPWRDRYRQHLLRPVWRSTIRVQTWLDRRLPTRLFQRRVNKVAAHLDQLIAKIYTVGAPLVIVCGLGPPSGKFEAAFPGMAARIDLVNAAHQEIVARRGADRDVRYLDMRALFGDEINSLDALQLDGVHPTSYWHREIAATIADDVESWLDALGDRRPWAQQEALQRIEREAQQAAVEPMGQALSPDSSSS